nr:probable galacturonosyltransferase 6 isoform X1 [Ipomoea trifida]
MKKFHRCTRIFILSLLFISVCVPICFLSHKIKSVHSDEPGEFVEDLSIIKHRTEAHIVSALEEEESEDVKEPLMVVYKDDKFSSDSLIESNRTDESGNTENATLGESGIMQNVEEENQHSQHEEVVRNSKKNAQSEPKRVQHDQSRISHSQKTSDVKLKEMKDQIIRAKVYLSFSPQGSKSHIVKEIKMRIKDLERAMGEVTKDSDLSRRAVQKMKAMEATLLKASHMFPECTPMVKKLRAMTDSAEEQLRTHKNQVAFLEELAGRTTPKGLHCFSMRLTAEYFALMPEEREFPNQHKLHNPDLYHFAVFSDNILACSVVVNSTISSAKDPEKIVFHIVTDSVSLPAISMWFLLNPPVKATIHIQSIDNIKWLSTKYDANLQKQESLDPRYASALNHLRFYLPDIFPLLDKLVFLDHDVVVQRDLSALWRINMKGKVNGAVQTCKQGEPSFRRMDAFINFTDPMMAKRFDVETCTWAFGMNLFDLKAWRHRNLTAVYHKYLQLGSKKPLLKAGTLPIGWITFYKHTVALDRSWHVLGLGYDSGVPRGNIEQAAVIHYDGKMKPWLDIGLEKYKPYWRKHVNYEQPHLQQCNIHS